ncbi:tetratricopeptide repeat protein [Bifidobacterium dolichotidis]|uniref:Tetratricopeptide repeat protein n=1 Tax=Bifidobacterium dolichotidis TaxID=2306976 RepID=A0A430FQJ4_9BIFI|nr:tetratricopeptide repeat protein [Bifidobacterium dolichotidis]RSX55113.1 tetratricopeptide repeat protein [Bifidobacterium dolichotidis]
MDTKPNTSNMQILPLLPEQDAGATYAVLQCEQDHEHIHERLQSSLDTQIDEQITIQTPYCAQNRAYVGLVLPNNEVQILARIDEHNAVYAADRIEESSTEEEAPQLEIQAWTTAPNAGAIRLTDPRNPERKITVGEYGTKRGEYSFLSLNAKLGAVADCGYELDVFLALAWLATYYIPQLRGKPVGMGAGRLCEVFDEMMDMPLPDAIDMMIWKGATNNQNATDFERYAARQLIEAGAGQLRQIACEHEIHMVRLHTRMFWFTFDSTELKGLQRDIVLATEAAMNRLAFLDLDARELDSEMGLVGTVSERMAWQSTHDALHMFAKHAGHVERTSKKPNTYATVYGTQAAPGGVWDISTRFANLCETLILLFRLDYRFDIDLDQGMMAIHCSVPTEMMFPSSRFTSDGWVDTRSERPAHTAAYAMRLATLMAQIAFSSSVRLTQVQVNCYAGGLQGSCVLSLDFDRMPFQINTLPALTSGTLDSPRFDADPLALFNLINPSRHSVQFTADRGLAPCEPLPVHAAFASKHLPVWADERELPESMAQLLHAQRACDLDVMNDTASIAGKEVWDIYESAEDAPASAQMDLESVLLQLEVEQQASAASADGASSQLLFCERPLMRALVSLTNPPADLLYEKAPDALYNAHLVLCRINRDMGNFEASIRHARQAQALAVTTPQPLVEESITHAELHDDFSTAVEYLIRALQIATVPVDVAFIYYRLAFAYWQLGNQRLALACYTRVLIMKNSPVRASAIQEVQQLIDEMHGVSTLMTNEESLQVLRNAGVPTAPTNQVRELLAKAAVGLVDAGFPRAADDMVWMLGTFIEGDVISAIAASLRWGIGEEVGPTEFQGGSEDAMFEDLKRSLEGDAHEESEGIE